MHPLDELLLFICGSGASVCPSWKNCGDVGGLDHCIAAKRGTGRKIGCHLATATAAAACNGA